MISLTYKLVYFSSKIDKILDLPLVISKYEITAKILKIGNPENIAVITLKIEQCGFAIE